MFDRRLRRYVRHGMMTQLAAFEAVVRLGGFTRAGEALHMAQPTVSLLIKKLGEALGVTLFESTAREIRLTPAGVETYHFCQAFFRSFAAFDDRLMTVRAGASFTLRIAVCADAAHVAPAMLFGYCKTHPDIKLALAVANRAQLLERLSMGSDNLYIFGAPPLEAGVCMHPLRSDEFNIYASAKHPYAKRAQISLDEISHEPFIAREAGSRAREVTDAIFAERQLHPNVHMEMESNDEIARAVAAGVGVALLSRCAVQSQPHRDGLVALRVDELPIRHQWQLVYRDEKKRSDVENELIDLLCEQAATRIDQMSTARRPGAESAKTVRSRSRRELGVKI